MAKPMYHHTRLVVLQNMDAVFFNQAKWPQDNNYEKQAGNGLKYCKCGN